MNTTKQSLIIDQTDRKLKPFIAAGASYNPSQRLDKYYPECYEDVSQPDG